MKSNLSDKVANILMIIAGILLLLLIFAYTIDGALTIISGNGDESIESKVPCYDKNNHEMIGQTCIKKEIKCSTLGLISPRIC